MVKKRRNNVDGKLVYYDGHCSQTTRKIAHILVLESRYSCFGGRHTYVAVSCYDQSTEGGTTQAKPRITPGMPLDLVDCFWKVICALPRTFLPPPSGAFCFCAPHCPRLKRYALCPIESVIEQERNIESLVKSPHSLP